MKHTMPIATVDVVIFTIWKGQLAVVLNRRERDPFQGHLALPGGYVYMDEDDDTLATARRVLLNKTGIEARHLEQFNTFSGRYRDPRGWSVSIAYFALMPEIDTQGELVLTPVDGLPALPFDHNVIISAAVTRLRSKSTYSSLPAFFMLPEVFSLPELQRLYETILGAPLDRFVFRRRMEQQGMIEQVEGALRGGRLPLYRLTAKTLTEFDRLIV